MQTNIKLQTNSIAENLFEISSYLSPLNTVIKADADKTLGSVLTLVDSSHSPLIIFDKDDQFIGLVSPHQALYTQRYPYTTKLSSIATMPPYLTQDTQLYDVASSMLESRVYALPIFDENKKIVGVVHAEDIFKNLINDSDLLTHFSISTEFRPPIMAKSNATVGDIFQKMRDLKTSRIVLVDEEGALAGIVSRKDLHEVFMKPTEKKRFGKNGNRPTDRAYDVEKEYRKDEPVSKYAVELVHTLSHDIDRVEMIKKLVASEHNSVVLVDKQKRPVGILSMRDILGGLASLRPEETINLIMSKPTSNVSEDEVEEAEMILTTFSQKMNKRVAIDKIEVTFEEPKTPAGGSTLFNTTLIVSPIAGAKFVSKTKSRSFADGVQSAIAQIEKQQRRSGLSRAATQ